MLRPSVDLIDTIRDTPITIELTISEAEGQVAQTRAAFDGHAIWVGGDSDVLVPQEMEARWQQELSEKKSEQHLSFWLPPVAPTGFALALRPGQDIQVRLLKKNNDVYAAMHFRVEPLRNSHDFVQEEILNVPSAAR